MSKIRISILLIVLSNLYLFCQKPKIDAIKFEYENDIKSNSYIRIAFYSMDAYSKTILGDMEVKSEKSKIEIPFEKFKEIRDDFFKLSPKDIIKNDSLFVMDGATINLSYTNYDNTITYSCFALSKSDETTSRQDLLAIVRKILQIADIKIREIN